MSKRLGYLNFRWVDAAGTVGDFVHRQLHRGSRLLFSMKTNPENESGVGKTNPVSDLML